MTNVNTAQGQASLNAAALVNGSTFAHAARRDSGVELNNDKKQKKEADSDAKSARRFEGSDFNDAASVATASDCEFDDEEGSLTNEPAPITASKLTVTPTFSATRTKATPQNLKERFDDLKKIVEQKRKEVKNSFCQQLLENLSRNLEQQHLFTNSLRDKTETDKYATELVDFIGGPLLELISLIERGAELDEEKSALSNKFTEVLKGMPELEPVFPDIFELCNIKSLLIAALTILGIFFWKICLTISAVGNLGWSSHELVGKQKTAILGCYIILLNKLKDDLLLGQVKAINWRVGAVENKNAQISQEQTAIKSEHASFKNSIKSFDRQMNTIKRVGAKDRKRNDRKQGVLERRVKQLKVELRVYKSIANERDRQFQAVHEQSLVLLQMSQAALEQNRSLTTQVMNLKGEIAELKNAKSKDASSGASINNIAGQMALPPSMSTELDIRPKEVKGGMPVDDFLAQMESRYPVAPELNASFEDVENLISTDDLLTQMESLYPIPIGLSDNFENIELPTSTDNTVDHMAAIYPMPLSELRATESREARKRTESEETMVTEVGEFYSSQSEFNGGYGGAWRRIASKDTVLGPMRTFASIA